MESMNRRSAMAVGLTVAAATPLLALTTPARAREYGPNEGTEFAPGVRWVDVGEGNSDIPAYKSIKIGDAVFQPGSMTPESLMDDDMFCTILQGEFTIKQGDKEFTVKEGDMYTCGKGRPESSINTGAGVGVHRLAILIAA